MYPPPPPVKNTSEVNLKTTKKITTILFECNVPLFDAQEWAFEDNIWALGDEVAGGRN